MMTCDEKELMKLLNREKVEDVSIFQYGISITTEDHEIYIYANNDDEINLEISDREFIE